MRALAVAIVLLALAAAGAACGTVGGGDRKPNATEPGQFGTLRASVRAELDNIGPNIDVVPPDVLRNIIDRCHQLEQYADKSKVSPLCDAIQRAHDNKDAALVDQVVAQLDLLKPK